MVERSWQLLQTSFGYSRNGMIVMTGGLFPVDRIIKRSRLDWVVFFDRIIEINLRPRAVSDFRASSELIAGNPYYMTIEVSVVASIGFVTLAHGVVHASCQRRIVVASPCVPFPVHVSPKNFVIWRVGIF